MWTELNKEQITIYNITNYTFFFNVNYYYCIYCDNHIGLFQIHMKTIISENKVDTFLYKFMQLMVNTV